MVIFLIVDLHFFSYMFLATFQDAREKEIVQKINAGCEEGLEVCVEYYIVYLILPLQSTCAMFLLLFDKHSTCMLSQLCCNLCLFSIFFILI